MGTNSVLFRPRTKTGKVLWAIWDAVDISENMHRTERHVRKIDNGFASGIMAGGMFFLFLVAAWFAWFWDIESTIAGMSDVTTLMIPSLPRQVAKVSWLLILGVTIAPTLLELFTAGLAKENIKSVQLLIIGFTLFDVITDIPRTYSFIESKWAGISLIVWPLNHIIFWTEFFLWLAMATLGFEVVTILFGYAALSFAIKALGGSGASTPVEPIHVVRPQQQNQQQNNQKNDRVTVISQ